MFVFFLLASAGPAGAAEPAGPAQFHVSPAGSDSGDGSAAKPFATPGRARQAVRDLLKAAPAGGSVEVVLAAGTYRLEQTLELTSLDSLPGRPVTWRAAAGQEVRLAGGIDIPAAAFAPVRQPSELERLDPAARGGQVLRADLKALGLKDVGTGPAQGFAATSGRTELFFADQPMTLARWPNEGFVTVAEVVRNQPHSIHGIPGDKVGTLVYSGDRPARWAGQADVFLHGYWFWDWADEHKRIDAIDPAKKQIVLAQPHHGYGYRKGQRFYALNLLCELDAPGEWYLDRAAGVLYFWPPRPLAAGRTVLSVMNRPLLVLRDATGLTLRGLTIEAGRDKGIEIAGGQGVRVVGCTVRNFADCGLYVHGGTRHSIVSCDVYNTGAMAVSIEGGDRRTLTPCGHSVVNCDLHHFGRLRRTYTGGLHIHGVGLRAAHNRVHDGPHLAVAFGGNENVMELNELYNVCRETGDVGVFYTGRDWTVRGNVIRHNFIHHVSGPGLHGAQGIYLDDAASGSIVSGNVQYKVARAFLLGGGRDNLVENNLSIECPQSVHFDNRGLNWMKDTISGFMTDRLKALPYQQPPWSTKYPQLLTVLQDEPGSPKGNVLQRNVMVRCGPMHLAPEVIRHGTIRDNVQTKDDPGFVDAAKMDFRFRPDAPILKRLPQWQPIPLDKVGLQVDDVRTTISPRD